jgi:hypothetical protein
MPPRAGHRCRPGQATDAAPGRPPGRRRASHRGGVGQATDAAPGRPPMPRRAGHRCRAGQATRKGWRRAGHRCGGQATDAAPGRPPGRRRAGHRCVGQATDAAPGRPPGRRRAGHRGGVGQATDAAPGRPPARGGPTIYVHSTTLLTNWRAVYSRATPCGWPASASPGFPLPLLGVALVGGLRRPRPGFRYRFWGWPS